MPNASPANQATSAPEPSASDVVEPLWKKVLNDRFTILEPIGVGGMGKVYKAIQSPLDRVVAIKILTPNGGVDPGFRQRFFLEASLTSKLRHPNTVTVIDYGETPDGIFYLAMEYLDGQPLSQVLAGGPLHWTRCIRIAQQICRSLREAHKLGIVHRDLKPANVMLLTEEGDQDSVKVLDFGLVKSFLRESDASESEITNPGMLLGSPRYMAPEQLRNQADPRSDVYALGTVLYEMLVGQPVFVAKDAIDVMFKHMNEAPAPMRTVRPDIRVPKEVEALVMKCLEKQPAWRFQSMDDVLEAMRKAANAAGAAGILSEGAVHIDTSPSQILPRSEIPLAEPPSEGTLAIEIDVVPPPPPLPSPSARTASARNAAPALGTPSDPLVLTQPLQLLRDNPKVRAALIPVSIGVALLIASVAYLTHRSNSAKPEPQRAQPTEAVPSTAAPLPAPVKTEKTPSPPARVAKTVAFKISTEPAGARVFLNGHSVGYTPLSVDVPAGSNGRANAELIFMLRGYQPLTVSTGGSGPQVVLTQRLQPISSSRPPSYESRRREPPPPREAPEPAKTPESEPPALRKTPAEDESKVVASLEVAKPKEIAREPLPVAPPPPPSAVLSFREGMSAPEQLQGSPIVYTREALEAGVQGTIRAKCVINLRGALENCRIIHSLPYMDRAVLDALATRRYKPILFEGKPVAVEYVFDIKLVLKEKQKRCFGSRCMDE